MNIGMSHLRAFVAVADAGSFSEAAADLGISQSAVSHAVASLERALGGPVLVRGATVRTTALGQEIIAHGRAALRACAAIQEASGRHGGRLTGTVRVAAPPTVCHGLLPAFLAEWKSAFPHVRPVVLEGDDEEVHRWLRDSVADLAVLVDPAGPIDGVELGTDRFHALLPSDHPLAAEETIEITDLDDDPFILSQGGCEKYVREAYRKAGGSIRPAHHVRDMTTLLTMVRSGIGVSVVPELTRSMLDERLVLVPLAQRVARRLVLAGPQDRPWSPAATALARTCSAHPPSSTPAGVQARVSAGVPVVPWRVHGHDDRKTPRNKGVLGIVVTTPRHPLRRVSRVTAFSWSLAAPRRGRRRRLCVVLTDAIFGRPPVAWSAEG